MSSRKRMRTEMGARPSRTSWLRARQRKRKSRNRSLTVPRNKLGFPQSMKTKLRFVDRFEFSPSDTSVLQRRFRANDLYDPVHAIGGHQPRGFDEFMSVYKSYTVLGSKISVNCFYEGYDGPSTTGGVPSHLTKKFGYDSNTVDVPALSPVICGLHKGIETLGAGTAAEQMEKDRTSWVVLTGSTGAKTLRGSLKTSDFFGKEALVGAEGYTGTDSSVTANEVYWEVWCGRASDNYPADTVQVVCYATIEFDAVFTEPKTLEAS